MVSVNVSSAAFWKLALLRLLCCFHDLLNRKSYIRFSFFVSMEIEKELIDETEEMLAKIKKKIVGIRFKSGKEAKGKEMMRNIEAYISDTEHFLSSKKRVKAFEAVVWAWAWIEILEELGIFVS